MLRRGRAFLFVGLAGLALALLGQLDALGPITAAGITVASSVGLALIAHGGAPLAGEAVAFGASGAVAYEATRSYVPLIASGLLLTFVFGTRAMRSRTWRELGFHLALAFASGVAASWVARANAGLEASLWMTAIMVASLLASAPWIVPNDAPRTFALRRLASRARGATKLRLLRAVVAHRRLGELELPRALRRSVERAFDDVIRRAERRLDGEGGGAVERTIEQLVRVERAARSREALIGELDEGSERLAADGDALEAEIAALVELR